MESNIDQPNEPERRPDAGGEARPESEARAAVEVQFTGVWTADEQEFVRAAAADLSEQTGRAQHWHCACTRLEGTYQYHAHRPEDEAGFKARTVEDLVRKMRDRVMPT